MKKALIFVAIMAFAMFFLVSCNKKQNNQGPALGNFSLAVSHTVNGNPLKTNQFIYTNAAGNTYSITEVQWFISDIKLHKADGSFVFVTGNDEVFYIDNDIESSKIIRPLAGITPGEYSALSFTFGLNEVKNKSLRYVNPPESFMFWPDYLGGGYHYMKINGKWINNAGIAEPFNFHLGIGQRYDTTAKLSNYLDLKDCCLKHCTGYSPNNKIQPIIGFEHNYFEVHFSHQPIFIYASKTTKLSLEMKIENWFKGVHNYDHNVWGGSIMQQQNAMKMACENGRNVFQLSVVE